jgi:anaerobic selenocysteine-containing dehydrogenase
METATTTNQWRSTACGLCYVNCGIEVMTQGHRMVRIRGDRAHPSRAVTRARRHSASTHSCPERIGKR